MSETISINTSTPEKNLREPPPCITPMLSWNNLVYEVPIKEEVVKDGKKATIRSHRRLLKDISGRIMPGEMTAIIGSSGAGKTTLLDTLAGRLKGGNLSGSIAFQGQPRDIHLYKHKVAFVEQEDLLYSTLTVEETIRYAAELRMPSRTFSQQERSDRVERVISDLRLNNVRHTRIGGPFQRGVSGGEKKRVSIGVEMVTDPSIIFLDEPTSGLDSNSADMVVEMIHSLTKSQSCSAIMTLHQPSAKLLNMFDKVILLSGGEIVYQGWVSAVVGYFGDIGYPCPPRENPADYFIDLMTIDYRSPEKLEESHARVSILTQAYRTHAQQLDSTDNRAMYDSRPKDEHNSQNPEVYKFQDAAYGSAKDLEGGSHLPGQKHLEKHSRLFKRSAFPNSWFHEFGILARRYWVSQMRNVVYLAGLGGQTLIMFLLIGFTYFQMGTDGASIQNRIGLLYFLLMYTTFPIVMPLLQVLIENRAIMLRERASGVYRVSSYYLSTLIVQLPFAFIPGLLLATGVYFLTHLQYSAAKYFTFFAITISMQLASVGLAFMVSAAVETFDIATIIAPTLMVLFILYGGNLANAGTVTPVLRWIKWVSYMYYGYSGIAQNEFRGLTFHCKSGTTSGICFANGEEVVRSYNLEPFSIGVFDSASKKSEITGRAIRATKGIIAKDGWKGLYRGLSPNLAGNTASWGLYFAWYGWIKDRMAKDHELAVGKAGSSTLSPAQHLFAGAVAGALTQCIANPLWVVKVRMCTTSANDPGAYTGLIDGLKRIYISEGVPGLYRGLVPGLIGVSHGAIQFTVYEEMKKWRANSRASQGKSRLTTTEYTMMSLVSKTFAAVVTYPYQVIRARLQQTLQTSVGNAGAGRSYNGTLDALVKIYRSEGLTGFHKGMGPNVVRMWPGTAITFAVYENVASYLRGQTPLAHF
ncbi:hypothetical protein H4219_001686 [Mycoemilia scoparia]|uniref:ABC transporter domain-containing protein n=1 Tax=Mycoemilia scoparia TaxID=417184 RepID=A0A9W8A2Z0_9FUNG|nr:hypothetical protein H4219_001686 [Mycoemilia scoparia]